MYARGTALVVLAILLFSSFSGMVSGSTIEGYDQSVDNSDQVSPDESNWTLFENPVGHLHQIKQSSGLIHSPFGSFDPLDQEIPMGVKKSPRGPGNPHGAWGSPS